MPQPPHFQLPTHHAPTLIVGTGHIRSERGKVAAVEGVCDGQLVTPNIERGEVDSGAIANGDGLWRKEWIAMNVSETIVSPFLTHGQRTLDQKRSPSREPYQYCSLLRSALG